MHFTFWEQKLSMKNLRKFLYKLIFSEAEPCITILQKSCRSQIGSF